MGVSFLRINKKPDVFAIIIGSNPIVRTIPELSQAAIGSIASGFATYVSWVQYGIEK